MRVSPGLMTFLIGLVLLALAAVAYQSALVKQGKVGGGSGTASSVEAESGATRLYTCPMHPQIIKDHPGTCPICGMELVLKDASAGDVDAATSELIEAVKLSPLQAVLADVQAVHPERREMQITVTAIGEVKVQEGSTNDIVSWIDGRVDNLVVRETGVKIQQGDHLLDIYSEMLVQAQEEYLLALDAAARFKDSDYAEVSATSRSLVDAARQKLSRLGLNEKQLQGLDETHQAQEHVPIYATHGGTIMEKMVTEGMYVMRGERLFMVVDLSSVWVELSVFEKDVANIKVGDKVSMDCPVHPGMLFKGTVELIKPELNMETRTFSVRVGVDNPDMILRPGMILDAELTFGFGKLLLLPRNAVLHTGDGDLVYVSVGENMWEPRRVTVGRDFGDMVEILSGLKPDEGVAATAVFLLDSDAILKGVPRPIDLPAPPTEGKESAHAGH